MPTIDPNGALHDNWGRFSSKNTPQPSFDIPAPEHEQIPGVEPVLDMPDSAYADMDVCDQCGEPDETGYQSEYSTDLCAECYTARQQDYWAGALGVNRMTAATAGNLHADACERALHERSTGL